MPAEQDKIATLRQAAAAKREAAVARAETGIRKLTKTGQPVTFRADRCRKRRVGGLPLPPPRTASPHRTAPRSPACTRRTRASQRTRQPRRIQRRRHLDGQADRAAPRTRRNQGPARGRPRRAARAAQAPAERRSRRRMQPAAVLDDASLKTRHQRRDLAVHASEAGQGQITGA